MAQLGYYNESMEFVVEPGNMHLMVGTSAANLTLNSRVLLTGKPADMMGRRSYVCHTEVH